MSRPVAIIGIGLRLPQADTLDQFWRHLAAGRSLISEVPAARWDKAALHGNPASGNRTASIWGGFIDDADCFDAPFFSVSPREAAWMDPQQRFALEMAWHAIEDAGYRAADLSGSRTGVYMGVCHWDYAELLEKHLAQTDAYMPTGIAFSIIANRVSHFFDLHGPSIANDTACAASLTAIYEAVRALDAGDCEMALAGGVNLAWSPNHFVAFSKAGMLSKEGSGKAFDDRADGYVRGEGGGVLLLKPLDRALADGDPIHAVIRGIGVNHGGRTSSLTVTSPDAQAQLIESVHRAAGVTPDRVSYIEAHGPGTPLGDPIEIAGLKQAFAALHAAAGTTPVAESCGIGSVKTNIGHLEGAAGVAGIAKLLAALRHGVLPANVGFETLNRLIDLTGSPFRIQAERRDWPSNPERPRLAGISSFGFGGANAHALLEEAPVSADTEGFDGPFILPISARDEGRLKAYAERLRDWLEDAPDDLSLADLAYTFQTARVPMEARAAFVASDKAGLIDALQGFLAGEALDDGPHADLASRWRAGADVDWSALYTDGQTPRRIHAPLYPFARHRYWMDASLAGKDTEAFPHPLVQRNLSGLGGPRYLSRLGREAFYWADHHVGGQQILPGVACLEAARAALEQARGGAPLTGNLSFEQVSWTRPIRAAATPVEVETRLEPQADGGFGFTISAQDGAANAQGVLRLAPLEPLPALDIAALAGSLHETVDPAECYRRLTDSGVAHGPAFQALRSVRRGSAGVLAELRLGRLLHGTLAQLPLHPVLLDAAIQAWIALDETAPAGSAVPFACGRIEMHGPCTPVMHAHVRRVAGTVRSEAVVRLDLDLVDKDGKPCLAFRDLALRLMASKPAAESAEAPTVHLAGRWIERPARAESAPRETHIYLAGFAPDIAAQLAARTGLPVEALPEVSDPAARAIGWFRHLHGALAARMRLRPALPQRFLVLAGPKAPAWLATPLAGLLRTAAQENPKFTGAVVAVEGAADIDQLAGLLEAERDAADDFAELRHDAAGTRLAWRAEEIAPAGDALSLNPEAAYWITGGLGRLGLILAGWLAARGARHIVLSGRRIAPDAAAEAALAALRAGGAALHLEACDVTDAEAVAKTVARIESDIGPLKGIIHAAGLLDDGYILTKVPDSIVPVLAPKIAGMLNIDRATRDTGLDFLLLCSSIAASFGNAGQGDYAGGNGFLDGFAEHRTRLAEAGERHGITLAIGWPLWAEGGMSVDATGLAALARRFGTVPMPTPAGLAALDRAVAAGTPRQVVLHGARDRIDALLAEPAPQPEAVQPVAETAITDDDGDLAARTIAFLKEVLAERLQMEPAQIRADRRLEEYGLDSITIVEATAQLEEALGPLSKTLFFEYVDLAGIATHLVEERRDALLAALPNTTQQGASQPKAAPTAAALSAEPPATVSAAPRLDDRNREDRHDIAIVGLSLRVARAASQDEFWEMLSNGLDGFEAYPAERWNHAALLHPERDVPGKTVVKTGAFLTDIDKFDPRYFRISQHEAELMSPEVRLFLEASVEAFEDAGYSREYMQARYGGDVAVLVGSMTNEYDLYGFQNMLVRGALASGSYTGTVPNMVSYFYGFTGPSYFLDTMCSASSTCVHEAVHMLRAGRCRMALAGGVSLLLHPQKLIATSQEHFTSKTAEKIRGYGLGADGTILGEGVGALVLKPLADAERDGDHIYGVIIGSGISNAGVRNGFTVPNPHQQAAAIEQALADAAIDPSSISYVEGHGSGTALGDPIEVKALTQAFRKYTDATGFCPLGTVKSNVAHLLAAAGVAGIAKVLAQLRHGQIAPSLHAEVLNPNIPFADTPFRVQRELAPWIRPRDAAGRELPRRAGVTSIGAGGMNSHILIEEHAAPPRDALPAGPALLVFSAMSEAALIRLLERMRDHVARHPDLALADLAYTLQTGRNELPCRLALVAADIAEVPALLAAFMASPGPDPHWHFVRSILEVEPPSDAARLQQDIGERALDRIGAAWAAGAVINWDALHEGSRPRRVSLPAYPFERVRCWYPEFADAPSVVNPLGSALKLHPFIGVNRSGLEGLRYSTAIHPGELLDYSFSRGRTRSILPTVAVEIALALGRIAGLAGPLSVRGLAVRGAPAWEDGSELHAALDPQGDGPQGNGLLVRLEMADAAGARTAYAEAQVRAEAVALPPEAVPSEGEALDGAAVTARLAERGYGFGPYLDVVTRALALPGGGLLCDLARAHPRQDFFSKNVQLPPRVLAALYQAMLLDLPPFDTPPLLAGIERAMLGDRAGEAARLLVRRQGDGAYAVWLFDAGGAVLGALDGVRLTAADALDHTASAPVAAADGLAGELRALAAAILKFPAEELNPREMFYELGFDSISLTRFAGEISDAYKVPLSPAVFFECEHIEALAAHLASRHGIVSGAALRQPAAAPLTIPQPVVTARQSPPDGAVAIIGLAGRFPGAATAEEFFARLLAGDDLTGDLPLARYGADYRARLEQAGFPKRGGFLNDIDRFDAGFFRISPVEAERLDPQQRLMLETAWRALEDAGYRPEELPRDTGVFVGVTAQDYAALLRDHGVACDGYVATGNSLAMVANRLSHFFDLNGPSEAVDTACSSALVALLRAADAVRSGRCGAALVGGVNLTLALEGFEGPHQAGMLSPEGRCKSFGAGADGYARGEGVVVVVVKPLAAAERDGDRILGLLIGGAENHGGRAGSLTAPNAKAQADLVVRAMHDIDPASIACIEAHGTGTALGDPVEANGLRLAYDTLTGGKAASLPPILLGSVKSNIGHLEAAAGLAGVAKMLLAMRHGRLPASLHCAQANPHLDLAGSPFRLAVETQDWPARRDAQGRTLPRRAGVSSFGFGGSNAHVVLEAYEAPLERTGEPRRQPLPPHRFAGTRYWIPGVTTETVTALVPGWVEQSLAPAGTASARHIVVAGGVGIVPMPGVELLAPPLPAEIGAAYGALADLLLRTVQQALKQPGEGPVLVQLAVPDVGDLELLAGLGAMLDSVAAEHPRLRGQTITLPAGTAPAEAARLLAAEATGPGDRHVRYRAGLRCVRSWTDANLPAEGVSWQEGAVTLIAGGMGGIGRLLARDIATAAPGSVLVLTGRTALGSDRETFLEELRRLGASAEYRQVDIADEGAVAALVREIVTAHGRLDRVVQAAGVLRDGYALRKSPADLAAVLAPKLAGALTLLRACRALPVQPSVVLFSSLAGAVGNPGQADYAAANGFLDALAEREGAEREGAPLLAIDWPLWRDGGMRVDATVEAELFRRMGQRPLETADGLALLRRALAAGLPRLAVIAGEGPRIRAFFAGADRPALPQTTATLSSDTVLRDRVTDRLRQLFAEASGLPADGIDPSRPLEEYGIDSLMVTRLNAALEAPFGALPKTLLFEHRTLAALAAHLATARGDACRRWTGVAAAVTVQAAAQPMARAASAPVSKDEPIAIIGLSGRYPGAADLDEFWANLAAGRDAITEIPAKRWDMAGFFEADADEAVASGRSYAKWGGFLDGFAEFDPFFFRISPRDAAAMDPQERLFLMAAWAAFEDAGYGPSRLARQHHGRVGVFAGVTKTGYALHGPFRSEGGAMVRPATSFASVANRVSHALDLTGPSLPVDTMCSSSLTAIHEACAHLRAGSCEVALAGGVNLYLHPANFVELSAARMLSAEGRCKSFGAGGDGFVPGEGVGCVILKPLSRALADGDRIHALIRATAINHGGHANGYTVPSPAAQRDLIRETLARAGLSADAVTCIEAHGTGTALGDPIELDGLTQAFRADTDARGFCALGSVKSNIGHLEAAAGIAGLTKILLQMRHGMLAPTLHASVPNPNLALADSPFRLQQDLTAWQGRPRLAGLSSFGAGGANAHAIIEEWPTPSFPAKDVRTDMAIGAPLPVLLSARDPERLREMAERLLAFIEDERPEAAGDALPVWRTKLAELLAVAEAEIDSDEPLDSYGVEPAQLLALKGWAEDRSGQALDAARFTPAANLRQLAGPVAAAAGGAMPALADISHTLQIGREALECRLAIEAASLEELAKALRAWLDGRKSHPGLHEGNAKTDRAALAGLLDAAEARELAARWLAEGRFGKVLSFWTKGQDIDWPGVPGGRIVSLPTYPFARQRFWIPRPAQTVEAAVAAVVAGALADSPAGRGALESGNTTLERQIAPVLRAVLTDLPEEDVIPELRRWRQAALALLAAMPAEAPADWDSFAAAHREDSALAARIALVGATLRALPDILAGRVKPTAVMFPDGGMGLVEGVYKDNPVAARFSDGLAGAAAAFVAARLAAEPDRPLRILEIGAGTGGTSVCVFRALAPHRAGIAEYLYTDVSRAFLIHAERSYADTAPNLATALFDVEKPLAGQAVTPQGYDLVIAANVLHATEDMCRTLATVRDTLAPGGLLLANETSAATLFTHVTFGLLEGWWRFTDPEVRIPGTPSLTPHSWRALLEAAGLVWVAGSPEEELALGQQLIAARLPTDAAVAAAAPVVAPPKAPERSIMAQPSGSLRDVLLRLLAETLNVTPASIDVTQSFADYGLDSILGMELVHRLRRALAIEFDQTRLFDFASVAQLEGFIAAEYPAAVAALGAVPQAAAPAVASPAVRQEPKQAPMQEQGRQPIAIIGASGRFAKSPDMESLWGHLLAGRDLVEPVSRFDLDSLYKDAAPGTYGRHGSFIDGIDQFDPVFFGISGLEATYMDPQQRLFLEEAWNTLENAGHAGADIAGRRVGVFVGCSAGDYHDLFKGEDAPGQAFWGNTISLIPARIAYLLDLKGPAVAVDTACSSALVALHLACQSLWNGEAEMALAGGVFVHATARFYRSANQAKMLSPSGRCAAFGAGADGIVPGEAVGAVLLRPMAEALADGDNIQGIIVASGTNQDGATNGITAPSAASQERLIRQVYDGFGIDPESIGMVEAHGTGTVLGDPIEHAALTRAFRHYTGRTGFCALGSVKSNIGHATTAAGIAGLAKLLLALRHRTIPPTIHVGSGNPAIRMADSPFFASESPVAWAAPQPGAPRRAAISSFGFSGTNAHAVVQEAPALPTRGGLPKGGLIVLSARTSEQLRRQAETLLAHLDAQPEQELADIAFTLLAGRRHLHHRLALVATDRTDLAARLRGWLQGAPDSGVETAELDEKDRRADPARQAEGEALAAAIRTAADPLALLPALALHYLAGDELNYGAACPADARRVPLPTYPFERKRYWVKMPEQPKPAVVTAKAGAQPVVILSRPAALPQPVSSSAAPPKIRLAPLAAIAPAALSAAPAGDLRRLPDADGVRRLELSGGWSDAQQARLAGELAAASTDESVRAVLVTGDWDGTAATSNGLNAALDCAVPVVAALAGSAHGAGLLAALQADFLLLAADGSYAGQPGLAPASALMDQRLGREAAHRMLAEGRALSGAELRARGVGMNVLSSAEIVRTASALAVQIAKAPRVSLVELKRHMRRALPPRSDLPADDHPLLAAIGDGVATPAGNPRRIALTSPVVELEFWPDGVALLRLCERQHKNTFTPAFMDGIQEAFAAIARLPEAKVVVLTGHDGYFACGGTRDGLTELQSGATRFTDLKIYSLPLECELPVIAAMQGHGIGAGWSLGMYCDLALFGAESVYHSNYLWFGFTPGAGATLIFPERLGDDLGREVLFTAREYKGRELAARRPGLTALPAAEVLPRALAMAHALAARPRGWLVEAKAALAKPLTDRLADVLAREVAMHETTFIGNARVAERIAEAFPQAPAAETPEPAKPAAADGAARLARARGEIVATLAEELMIEASDIRDSSGFLDLGLDSILAVTWLRRLNGLFGIDLPATSVYAHPTVGALAAHVATLLPAETAPQPEAPEPTPTPAPVAAPAAPAIQTARPEAAPEARPSLETRGAVAVIGASGQFPKADDLEAFWENIRSGRDCIEEVPADRWDIARHYHPDPQHPDATYCKWMGALSDIDRFDAGFFTMTPREAELTDPQQRLFLQHAWHAIEDAALDPLRLGGAQCGVFVSSGPSGYADLIAERNAYSLLGSSGSILAARIAHLLDLRGPSLSIDTACSSSLVAIAEACNSLLLGDSDLALAGGACVLIGPSMFIDTAKVGMLSKDGRCFTFDARANGFVPGEGVGVLLLKRLEDALADGDPVRAVIRGWGTNQDGRTNGITAPNPQAQTRLMQSVHRKFGIDPASIGLIECHGTGTALGDPIEIEGLCDAFAGSGLDEGAIVIGSVKSNVGHLLAAAGVAGAMKAMLALEQAELPPAVNFQTLNPHIRLTGAPFRVNSALRKWQAGSGPRRVAVSSFGFSGTNAHLVMEEAPSAKAGTGATGPYLFLLSARDRDRLTEYAAAMERFVAANPDLDLGDLAHTLRVGRSAFATRLAFVFRDRAELLRALSSIAAGQPAEGVTFDRRDAEAADAGTLDGLALLWVAGRDVDFSGLPQGRRLRVPGYPFARDRLWVTSATPVIPPASPPAPVAHPLLEEVTATIEGLRVGLTLRGEEPWLTHHATGETRLSLGLFLPELARAALARQTGGQVSGLRHLVWGRPVAVNGHPRRLTLSVRHDSGGLFYQALADGEEAAPCHLGEALPEDAEAFRAPALDPASVQAGADALPAYREFAARCAVHSGPPAPEAASVQDLRREGGALTARLARSAGASNSMLIDPLCLDAVWRVLAFAENGESGALPFPYAMESVTLEPAVQAGLPAVLWLRLWRRTADAGWTAALHDAGGQTLLTLEGVLTAPHAALAEIRFEEEPL